MAPEPVPKPSEPVPQPTVATPPPDEDSSDEDSTDEAEDSSVLADQTPSVPVDRAASIQRASDPSLVRGIA